MGPSGCGKSTLLDTLAGRLASTARWEGDIRVNGHKAALSYGGAAYVTQDEVLIGTLTVRETLMFVAKLRLPPGTSPAARVKVVDDVVAELGLNSVENTFVGNWHLRGISGGQRRRVSIGCELVTSPTLLFLDEPTSGLDSAAAFHVMSAVRRLTEGCRTIVTVIHQPSSEVFELFDVLCLLAEGHALYFGEAHRAVDMFAAAGLQVPQSRSAPDHFLHCINRDFEGESFSVEKNVAGLLATFQESKMYAGVKDRVSLLHATPGGLYRGGREQPGWLAQTGVLTWRTMLNNTRNVGLFWMRLGMYVMLTLAVAFVYFQLNSSWKDVYSRAALLFFVVAFLTFMAIAAMPAQIEDIKVYIRERLNGYYRPSSFTVANTLASLPFILVIAIAASVCVYFIAHLRPSGEAWVYFTLALYISLVVVESMMMMIAGIVSNFLLGIAAGSGLLGLFMIVCGFFQPLNSMPAPIFRYPLSYLAFHTYAFTGFMRNEFEGTTGWGCPCAAQPGGCAVDQGPCSLSGADVLNYYEIMDINKWVNLAILIGMAVFYRLAFLATLHVKERRNK